MKKLCIYILVLINLSFNSFSQTPKTICNNNPLDCALELINTYEDMEKWDEELSQIAHLYWKLGNKKKAFEVASSIPDSDIQIRTLLNLATDLKKENNIAEYRKTYFKIYKLLKYNEGIDNIWKGKTEYEIIRTLTKLGYSNEVLEFVLTSSDLEDKSFGLLAIGEGVAESNQTKKALDLIPQIILNIELSKWNDLKLLVKVRVGKIFLKANKINEAKKLFNEVIENTSSLKVYENIFADQLWEEIIDAYKSKGLFDDSIKTLLAYKETNSLNSNDYAVKNLIEIYFLSNNTVEANKLMYQLGSSSEELDKLWVAEKYLQIGDVQAANDILLSLKIDTWQQDLSIQISEYYQKKSKLAFAIDVLNQAFARAEKINSNEPELAMMSTSPARQKASFMADIAKQFIKLNRLDLASIVINEIEKPYFKAQSLIKFAQNKNKKDANRILDQTLLLMKQNEDSNLDASKHENWNEIALAYKKIGQKEKSIEVFDQILNMERFNREKSTDSEIISGLAETGYYFTKSRVENNTKITNSLRKIMNIWAEGN